MDFDFEELYQAVILDHSRKPRNFGALPDATVTVSGDNPTCGDEIALSLKIDPAADKLEAVGFTGSGCSICMASTLSGVRKFPQRVKCATLGWHALRGCLAESGAGKISVGDEDADL